MMYTEYMLICLCSVAFTAIAYRSVFKSIWLCGISFLTKIDVLIFDKKTEGTT